MVADDLLARVGRLALFADLERDELVDVVGLLTEVSYGEGEWIVRRGDAKAGLHLIVEGEVGVVLDGEELATLPQGSFFGEISALLGEPVVADVVARTPLQCLFVPVESVEQFLLDNPRVMLRMLQTEARRLRTSDEHRT